MSELVWLFYSAVFVFAFWFVLPCLLLGLGIDILRKIYSGKIDIFSWSGLTKLIVGVCFLVATILFVWLLVSSG